MDAPTDPFGELLTTRLRVMSWNIWWRFGPWQERHPAIEATLKRVDADVIALQEVWGEGERTMAGLLATALGYHHVYAAHLDFDDGIRFGNAILSRWPIRSHDSRTLPALEERDEQRLVLRADIAGPRGDLQVFSTHLNWRFDHSHVRQAQVSEIADFIRASPPRRFPPVLCGDFNATPESLEMQMLTGRTTVPTPPLVFHDAWEVAGDGGAGHTWSNRNPFAAKALEPDRRLDYVLVGWPKSGGAGHVVRAEVEGKEPVGGIHPSDHYAMVAELRY